MILQGERLDGLFGPGIVLLGIGVKISSRLREAKISKLSAERKWRLVRHGSKSELVSTNIVVSLIVNHLLGKEISFG